MVNNTTSEKLAYSAAEAAQATGLSLSYMRGLISRGAIRSIKIGKRRLISRDTLVKFVEGKQ